MLCINQTISCNTFSFYFPLMPCVNNSTKKSFLHSFYMHSCKRSWASIDSTMFFYPVVWLTVSTKNQNRKKNSLIFFIQIFMVTSMNPIDVQPPRSTLRVKSFQPFLDVQLYSANESLLSNLITNNLSFEVKVTSNVEKLESKFAASDIGDVMQHHLKAFFIENYGHNCLIISSL